MSKALEQVMVAALELEPEDRASLIETLLDSLRAETDEIEAAWDEEIRRRVAALESGEAELIDAEIVAAEVRRLLE